MADLDWNLIRSFVAVAEAGSLSAAARRLSASQPTLGRHVAELEAQLGVRLFRRGRGGYALTQAGEALVGRARAVSDSAADFARLAVGAGDGMAGTVRVTASEVVAAYVLPPMLARLAASEPQIEVELVASNRVENLLARDADIAVRMVRPSQLDLVARKIADIPFVACAATGYLARRGRPAVPADLLGHDLVGFDRDMDIIEGFAALGLPVDRHSFRFRSDHQIVLWEAVKAGVGVGYMQAPLVAREPSVEAILPGLPLPALPVWLAMHRDVHASARIRRVVDFLAAELAAYVAG
jgi:DNA-binding transcriptional LysR family regulator